MKSQSSIRPADLRCEYRNNPRGIQAIVPRLSWILEPASSEARGLRQTAYQIEAASSPEKLKKDPDLWDSGRMESDQTCHIEYGGVPLKSRMECHWKVRVWDQNGVPSTWSEPAWWSMGLLDPRDWKAKWIEGSDPLNLEQCRWFWHPGDPEAARKARAAICCFQKIIAIPQESPVLRAALALLADDRFSLHVNGILTHKSSVETDDFKNLNILELGSLLKTGENLLSLAVTNATEGRPAGVTGKLVVRLQNQTQFILPIDETWKAEWIREDEGEAHKNFHEAWGPAKHVAHIGECDPLCKDVQPWGVPDRKDGLVLSPPILFRKIFSVESLPETAVVFVSALGIYSLSINGRRVGEDFFTPGWSDYFERIYYNTYDVAPHLKKGENAIGVILADGWHSGYVGWGRIRNRYKEGARMLVQLHLDYRHGSSEIIGTDESWKMTREGPWREADLLMGETYDARREKRGWDTANFDDSSWEKAALSPPLKIKVEAYPGEPVRAQEEIKPVSLSEPKPGMYNFDLGQNMVGVARLKALGPKGTTSRLRFAEILNEDGTLYTEALRGARATDTYIKRTDEEEIWMPRFTFHGFRYVEVTGLPSRPDHETITGIVLHSAMERAGEFSTSNLLVNRLYQNIVWGQKGNYLEVPTDCPQRDERLGWTGDAQIFIRTGTFNFQIGAFMTKWMRDLFDGQDPEGWFHVVAPKLPYDPMPRHVCHAWADAAIICPWNLYRVYGDTRIIERYYPAMARYIDLLEKTSDKLIRPADGFGDWVSLNADTPREVLNTAYFALVARMMAEMAEAIGKKGDGEKYRNLFDEIKKAFIQTFVSSDGCIRGNTQTCYVLALQFDLLPRKLKSAALSHLIQDLAYRGGHLSTGFVGLKDLIPTLSAEGRDDWAYRLLLNEDFPSWGYEIKCGATTVWERWDGWTEEMKLQTPGMNSFNHYAFGAVGEWLYSGIGGIDLLEPGYRRIRIRPRPGGALRFARVHYKSIRGWIESEWRLEDGTFHLVCRIPVNVSANIHIPCADPERVRENGKSIEELKEIRILGYEKGELVVEALSGHYSFTAPVV